MDNVTPKQRSLNMSKIRGKNTGPEKIVRKLIWSKGYRYRLHRKDLPGTPDMTFSKYHAVIFINGCFWHRHGCKNTTTPSTNQEFWASKFKENVSRDKRNIDLLLKMGWRVMIVWECAINDKKVSLDKLLSNIEHWLESGEKYACLPEK